MARDRKAATEKRARWKTACILFFCVLLLLYILLVNFLVSAALVPSFMEKLESFERITEESYAAQVQTSDIKGNRQAALDETNEWLKAAEHKKLSVETADGYTLVAQEFPADEAEKIPAGQDSSGAGGKAEKIATSQDSSGAGGGAEKIPASEDSSGAGGGAEEIPVSQDSSSTGEKNHKWALILHGYTGWKEEMYPFAYWYHEQGYHALVPDLRCQGESGGDFIGMGWTDSNDCILWINYILSQDEDAQIVLHGQSMGAATALMMSGRELPWNVQAVVSDCSYTDAYQMFGEKIKEWFHLPAFPLVDSACLALRLRGGYDLKDASALEAVQKSRTPTLFIHGDSDAMISVQMSKELYEAASCEKELLIVKGAGHGQAQEKDPETYFGTIRDFLDKTLESPK